MFAEFCNFCNMLEHMLHNRVVCRTNDKATKQPLLTKNKLTYVYKKASEIATN